MTFWYYVGSTAHVWLDVISALKMRVILWHGKWYKLLDEKKKLYRPSIHSLMFMFYQHKEHKVSNADHSRNETSFHLTRSDVTELEHRTKHQPHTTYRIRG